ncbi:MAG: site-specific DNA-methyltransferase [Armatimonadetes bacterium]|nr:site-specific DNA-methyltransferase [Armatimonadota bacterium]CUU38144.1 DNA methylase [Armatimonadetes bacterium DC]
MGTEPQPSGVSAVQFCCLLAFRDSLLDPFFGSGTTLLACVDLRRNGIGYEINPEIALEAVRRLRSYQVPLIENSGG